MYVWLYAEGPPNLAVLRENGFQLLLEIIHFSFLMEGNQGQNSRAQQVTGAHKHDSNSDKSIRVQFV